MGDFDQILEDCLERIAAGESAEQCLANYPAEATRLEPLLQVAEGLSAESRPRFSHAADRQAKARLLEAFPERNVSIWQRLRYAGKQTRSSRMVRERSTELPMSRQFSIFAFGFAALVVVFGIVLFAVRGGQQEIEPAVTQTQVVAMPGLPSPTAPPRPTDTPTPTTDERLAVALQNLPEPDRVENVSEANDPLRWKLYYGENTLTVFHFLMEESATLFRGRYDTTAYVWQNGNVIITGETDVVMYQLLVNTFGEELTRSAPPNETVSTYINNDYSFVLYADMQIVAETRTNNVLRVLFEVDSHLIEIIAEKKSHQTPALQWLLENVTDAENVTDIEIEHAVGLRYTRIDDTTVYLLENNELFYRVAGDKATAEQVVNNLEIYHPNQVPREVFELNDNDVIYRTVSTWSLDGENSADIFIKRNGRWQQIADNFPTAYYSILVPTKAIDDTLYLEQRTTGVGGGPLANLLNADKLFALSITTNDIQLLSECDNTDLFCIGDYNADFIAQEYEHTLRLYQHDGSLAHEFTPAQDVMLLGGMKFDAQSGNLAFVTLNDIAENVATDATVYIWNFPFDQEPQVIGQAAQLTPSVDWVATSICVQTYDGRRTGERCFNLNIASLPDPTIADGLLLRDLQGSTVESVVRNGALESAESLSDQQRELAAAAPFSTQHDGRTYLVRLGASDVTILDDAGSRTNKTSERNEWLVYGVVGDWLIVASSAPEQIIGAVFGELEAIQLDSGESRIIDDSLIFHQPVFAPDGSYMLFNTAQGTAIWYADGRQEVAAYENYRGAAFSADGRHLALEHQGILRIYDVATSQPVREIPLVQGGDAFATPRWHPDNQRIIVSGRGTQSFMSTYIIPIDGEIVEIENSFYPVISPGGNWLALYRIQDDQPEVVFYDLRTGETFVADYVGIPAGWIR